MKNIIQLLKILSLAVILSFGLSYVYAWTAPSATPPTGNVAAPINTSGSDQTKTGIFRVTDFVTNKITFTDGSAQTTVTNGGSHGKKMFTTVGAGVCPSATNCWTAPAGVTKVWVTMAGGGGGGGGGMTTGGGGGGAGAVVLTEQVTVVPLTNYAVTVGSAGTGALIGTGASGGNGSNSSFGSLLTANKGNGGQGGSIFCPICGSSGGFGGEPGGPVFYGTPNGTNGGSSIFGPGGAGAPSNVTGTAGRPGVGYGSGGGGGTNNGYGAGGNGATGFVLVEW